MLLKCCTHYARKFGKLNSGHKIEVDQSCPALCDPWTVAYQASPFMGLSGQEYWSGLPFLSPVDRPDPGIEPRSPTLWAAALPSEPPGTPQDWNRSIFILNPKKGNAKECSNYHTIALISYASNVMLKIFKARFQQYVNWELPDVQTGFTKDRGGLPWWLSGKESTGQCRGHRFNPRSEKISQATEQLSPFSTTTEPTRRSHWSSQAPEPVLCNKRSHHNEKPEHCNQRVAPLVATRESQCAHSNKDPAQPKINK